MTGYTSNANFGEMTDKGFTNNPNRRIPTEKAVEILEDAAAAGVLGVQFTGGGEPTVHKDHMALFRIALDLGLKCSLVTNGSNLAEGWQDVLPQFSWIRVSLDAGTEATYAKVRRVRTEEFGKTRRNLALLSLGLIEAHSDCSLGVSFIVTKDNLDEIELAARVSSEAGAQSIRYAAMFSPEMEAYYDDLHPEIKYRIGLAEKNVGSESFEVIDLFGQRLSDLRAHSPKNAFCGYQHMNVYIGGDLGVYRCCNTAYNPIGHVGSLRNMRFSEFLQSQESASKYADFDARGCAHCAFHGKNEILAYVTQKAPTHVEFA